MHILFIDFDGVITSARTGFHNIDIYAINFLLWICEKAKCKIVISSSWRHSNKKEFFESLFGEYLHEDYKTIDLQLNSISGRVYRGHEIRNWLEKHPEVKKYLILDDDYDMLKEQQKNFIQTNSYNGLMWEDMEKIMKFFNIQEFPDEFRELYQHPNMFGYNRRKNKK